jgi:hypothetical protein
MHKHPSMEVSSEDDDFEQQLDLLEKRQQITNLHNIAEDEKKLKLIVPIWKVSEGSKQNLFLMPLILIRKEFKQHVVLHRVCPLLKCGAIFFCATINL